MCHRIRIEGLARGSERGGRRSGGMFCRGMIRRVRGRPFLWCSKRRQGLRGKWLGLRMRVGEWGRRGFRNRRRGGKVGRGVEGRRGGERGRIGVKGEVGMRDGVFGRGFEEESLASELGGFGGWMMEGRRLRSLVFAEV